MRMRITMFKILAIGDCHACPETGELERFEWLGHHITERKPDIVVVMGDFVSLNSLSAWDSDKRRKMENRRYREDVAVGNEALDTLLKSLQTEQAIAKQQKKKAYRPKMFFLEGNHEERLERYVDYNPVLEGSIDILQDLKLEERGFSIIRYGEYLSANGTYFTHIPFAGNGKPYHSTATTSSLGKRILQSFSSNVVYGHTHRLEVQQVTRRGLPSIAAYNVGCYTADKQEDYAANMVDDSWKGVVHFAIKDTGEMESVECITKSKLKSDYEEFINDQS